MTKIAAEEFDSQMYAETKDLMGDGLDALLERFFASTRNHITTIDQALSKPDTKIIADLTHNIKSTSGGFGFKKVSQTAQSMEHLCRHDGGQKISEIYELHGKLKESLAAIEKAYRNGNLDQA